MTPTSRPLRIVQAPANPYGAQDTQLFLFVGNATIGPVHAVPDDGVVIPPPRDDLSSCTCRLKILHLNDLHGHIARFSSQGDQPILSRIVYRLHQLRLKHQHDPDTTVLAMSAGDDLVGAIFDELLGDDPGSFALHAGYRLYSAAGIDVSVLGNHDFDLGTEVLAQAIKKDALFPILSANMVGCQWLEGLVYPAALFVSKGIRVGVIGLTTRAEIMQPTDSNLQVVNPVRVIHNILPAIRTHCDVIIVLSHLGYSLASTSAGVRDAGDVDLARSLPYGCVHLIVGGHTHQVLNEQGLAPQNIVNGIPIVQAGMGGRFLGEVHISMENGHIAVTNARLNHTAFLPIDEAFEKENVTPLLNTARPLFSRVLGTVADHPDLSTDAVRNHFASGESALANFITDALVQRCRANGYDVDLAMIDASVVRCGLPVGDQLTFGDWFDLMPFADVLRIAWITGWQLRDLLQDNAFRIDFPGEPHTERGFLHFSQQVRYTIEAGRSRGDARVTEATVNDISLASRLERLFQVVCTSFVREPAAAWEDYAVHTLGLRLMDIHQMTHLDTALLFRDEMVAHIVEHGGVTEEAGARRDGRIRLLGPS